MSYSILSFGPGTSSSLVVPLVLLAGLGLRGMLVDFLISLTDALADCSFRFLIDSTSNGVKQVAATGLTIPSDATQELHEGPLVSDLTGNE